MPERMVIENKGCCCDEEVFPQDDPIGCPPNYCCQAPELLVPLSSLAPK